MSDTENVDFDYTKVKVKIEKETPPRNVENDTNNENSSHSENENENNNNNDQNDVKKPIEPIKSSNEILAELFKVFNAAPPPSLLDDDFLLKKSKKHKKDKKHHKKKSKKRGRSSSDEKQTEHSDDEDKAKKKHKKHKKHKKSKKYDSGEEKEKSKDKLPKVEVKKEKIDIEPRKDSASLKKQSDESDFVISDEEGEITNDKEPIVLRTLDNHSAPNDKVVKREDEKKSASASHSVTSSRSGISSSVARRIIIKSLKNSEVLKEAEKVQKENDKDKRSSNRGPDDSSELSLSDEETYLKEKSEGYYRRRELSDRRRRLSRSRYKDSSRDRFKRRKWRGSRSRSRSLHRRRSRSRSRSRRPDELIIDKKRLLEIARKNAISMFKSGSLPGTQSMTQETKDKVLMKMRYGGKSVEELTEFCKKLSKGGSLNDLSSVSSNEDSDHDKDGNEKAFHHPFVLKDRGPIVMNIKNATPIPPKTAEQTKAILMQYPVSSGQQHRLNESEWVPVSPKRSEPAPAKAQPAKNVFEKPIPSEKQRPAFKSTQATPAVVQSDVTPPASVPLPPVVNTIAHTAALVPPQIPIASTVPAPVPMQIMPEHVSMIPPPAPLPRMPPQAPAQTNLLQSVPPTAPLITMPTAHPSHIPTGSLPESVFPSQNPNIDVASIITKRLNAMRKLQENPTDPEALKMMYNSQKDMSAWVSSKFTPGQFTGSTGANVLSARELTAGHQAWVKRVRLDVISMEEVMKKFETFLKHQKTMQHFIEFLVVLPPNRTFQMKLQTVANSVPNSCLNSPPP